MESLRLSESYPLRSPKGLPRSQLHRPELTSTFCPQQAGTLGVLLTRSLCGCAPLDLCNGEAPLPMPQFPASRWSNRDYALQPLEGGRGWLCEGKHPGGISHGVGEAASRPPILEQVLPV